MRLTWSGRRQLLYYAVALAVLLVLAWGVYQYFFTAPPSCFDSVQNGDERGVDCGGSCSLVCPGDVHPLTVLWARPFAVSPPSTSSGQAGNYTVAVYVQSDNLSAGAKGMPYSFQLFDDKNSLIVERDGIIDIPPIETMPIIETNINTGTRAVSRVLFAFGTTPVWHTTSISALRVGNEHLAQDGSRLTATVTNDTLSALQKVTVAAVLFNASSTAVAASKSIVTVPKKGSREVIFTWPIGTPGVVRAEITILPPF